MWNYSDTYEYLSHVRDGMGPLILTCALSGGVQGKEANPALPETPDQLAASARDAYNAGASIVHVHLRDPDNNGRNIMRLDVAQETNAKIRELCPDIIINNTTGGGPETTMEERFVAVEARPELASLNLGPDMSRFVIGERGDSLPHPHPRQEFDECVPFTYGTIEKLAARMKANGVKPEMETYHSGMFWVGRELINKGLIEPPYLFQFVMGYQTSAFPTPQNLLHLIHELPPESIFFACGIGPHQLPMTTMSIIAGGHVRVGLEDNVYFSKGRKLSGNGEAVERAATIGRLLGREIASPAEARKALGISAEPRQFAGSS